MTPFGMQMQMWQGAMAFWRAAAEMQVEMMRQAMRPWGFDPADTQPEPPTGFDAVRAADAAAAARPDPAPTPDPVPAQAKRTPV